MRMPMSSASAVVMLQSLLHRLELWVSVVVPHALFVNITLKYTRLARPGFDGHSRLIHL